MSTKHNCPHPERGRSNYRARLSRRGLSKSPAMTSVTQLRVIQLRRKSETCSLDRCDHDNPDCTGSPWWPGYELETESNSEAEKLLYDIFAA